MHINNIARTMQLGEVCWEVFHTTATSSGVADTVHSQTLYLTIMWGEKVWWKMSFFCVLLAR